MEEKSDRLQIGNVSAWAWGCRWGIDTVCVPGQAQWNILQPNSRVCSRKCFTCEMCSPSSPRLLLVSICGRERGRERPPPSHFLPALLFPSFPLRAPVSVLLQIALEMSISLCARHGLLADFAFQTKDDNGPQRQYETRSRRLGKYYTGKIAVTGG